MRSARALEDFFARNGLILPTEQAERLASERRKRRIDAVPEPLRPAVAAFDASRIASSSEARMLQVADLDRVPTRSGSASGHTLSRWIPPPGPCCSGAWTTARHGRADPHVTVTRGRNRPPARQQIHSPTRMINANLHGVMPADDVVSILAALRNGDVDIWIGGGWGIDALVGQQTRQHRDLDLMYRTSQEPAVVATLANAGFTETLDWRPVRFVVTCPRGREIDLHPLTFAADGSAVQASPDPEHPFIYPAACFVTGTILGTTVPCLSPEQQVYFHQGYEPADHDRHDMAQLRETFGIATHF